FTKLKILGVLCRCLPMILLVHGPIGEVRASNPEGMDYRISPMQPEAMDISRRQVIKGIVRDENGNPMIGVSILEKGTNNGTVTDLDGSYSLETSDANSVLVFSYVGYQRQEVTAGNRSEINVSMEPDNTLEQVVVTALGIEKDRRDLGYSVSDVR